MGPVVVTGISSGDPPICKSQDQLQWGPVVVTGISERCPDASAGRTDAGFNGVRSW